MAFIDVFWSDHVLKIRIRNVKIFLNLSQFRKDYRYTIVDKKFKIRSLFEKFEVRFLKKYSRLLAKCYQETGKRFDGGIFIR